MRFTIPDPLHEGSSKLYGTLISTGAWRRTTSTDMCVALPYFRSSGEMVRKSELTASTLVQRALDSMFLRVENRLRSRSKAYNSQIRGAVLSDCRGITHQCETHFAFALHDGREVRGLVSWGRSGIYDYNIIASGGSKDVCWETRRFVLQDDLA